MPSMVKYDLALFQVVTPPPLTPEAVKLGTEGNLVSIAIARTSPAAAADTEIVSCCWLGWFVWVYSVPTAVMLAGVEVAW
jgi:hypothetical protein